MKSKPYKIKRYKKVFFRRGRRQKGRHSTLGIIIFILCLPVVLFLGYSVLGPLWNFVSGKLENSSNSSAVSSLSPQSAVTSQQLNSSAPSPVQEQADTLAYLPLSVARDAAKLDNFIRQIKAYNIQAAVIEFKDKDGILHYDSELEPAIKTNAVADNTVDAARLLKELEDNGITPVAKIHAFQDKTAPRNSGFGIGYQGKANWLWFDNSKEKGGKPWLNPYSTGAQDYIIDVALELNRLGFKHILVDSIMFPKVTRFYSADFGPQQNSVAKHEVLRQFTAKLRKELNQNNCKLLLGFDYSHAINSENIIYDGTNPITFDADFYLPNIMPGLFGNKLTLGSTVITSPQQQPTQTISVLVADMQAKNSAAKLIPQIQGISGQSDFISYSKEQIASQIDACKQAKTLGFYLYDVNGNYAQ